MYVLVGGPFQITDTEYQGQYFAEQLEIPEDLARRAITDGALMLPKDQFDSCGFNPEELLAFPNARLQANAPATFHTKHANALKIAREYRTQLMSGAVAGKQPTSKLASEVKT